MFNFLLLFLFFWVEVSNVGPAPEKGSMIFLLRHALLPSSSPFGSSVHFPLHTKEREVRSENTPVEWIDRGHLGNCAWRERERESPLPQLFIFLFFFFVPFFFLLLSC